MGAFVCALDFKVMTDLDAVNVAGHVQTGFAVLFQMLAQNATPCLAFCIGAASAALIPSQGLVFATALVQSGQRGVTQFHVGSGHLYVGWHRWIVNDRGNGWINWVNGWVNRVNWNDGLGIHGPVVFATSACASAGQLYFCCACGLRGSCEGACCIVAIDNHHWNGVEHRCDLLYVAVNDVRSATGVDG